jgi:hypothetical protein
VSWQVAHAPIVLRHLRPRAGPAEAAALEIDEARRPSGLGNPHVQHDRRSNIGKMTDSRTGAA